MRLQLGNHFDIIQPMVVLLVQAVLTQEIQSERSQDMISITIAFLWVELLASSFHGLGVFPSEAPAQPLSQVKLHSMGVGAYLGAFLQSDIHEWLGGRCLSILFFICRSVICFRCPDLQFPLQFKQD